MLNAKEPHMDTEEYILEEIADQIADILDQHESELFDDELEGG